ncbi:MAG: recombinase family protein [Leptolyngbyaceae cyanobacterium MO_188.B28]|nr:recombinase family protein [Leptolyngbyaceae cyanobacterium MO_188.B28]
MQQGVLQKAQRGELRFPLPTGYIHSPQGEIILDPDEQVQSVIRLTFQKYEEFGTINGVLRYLVQHDIRFGMRSYSSENKGELEWRPSTQATLQNLLTNPIYAGVYAYGRRQVDPRKQKPGRRGTGRVCLPPEQWHARLEQHVPAYISREQFQRNLARLKANQNRADQPGAVRNGAALLPGLLFCGKCDYRMAVSYRKDSRTYNYRCCTLSRNYGGESCQMISGPVLDEFISQQVLAALQPTALEVSLAAAARLEQEREDLHRIWRQRLERAAFEAGRAERHYLQVEPENRLVARQLGRDWEAKLVAQQQLQADYEQFLQQQPRTLSAAEQQAIRELAADIPTLWAAPTTTQVQRKEIIRQLISKVSIEVEGDSERVQVRIDWIGGNSTSGLLIRPVGKYTQLSYYPQLCERIRALRAEGLNAKQIAHQLNQEGFRPSRKTQTFNHDSVWALMRTLGLTHPDKAKTSSEELGPHEWWVRDLAQALDMPSPTLLSWRRKGKLQAREVSEAGQRWIIWADEAELERLRRYRHRSLKEEARQYWFQRRPSKDP